MSWNYRILRHPDENGEEVYGMHTVHYNAKGAPELWTKEPMFVGNSVQELLGVLEQIRDGVYKPIIDIRK